MDLTNDFYSLNEKVALISGASKGIGYEIALALAKAGAHIIVFDKDDYPFQNLIDQISRFGRKILTIKTDVANQASIEHALNVVMSNFSQIDMLVNSAGVSELDLSENKNINKWETILNTNLTGTYTLIQTISEHMIRRNIKGSIINIASINGIRPVKNAVAYCVSKAGIIHLTKIKAIELAEFGIRVNAIAPGYILTERMKPRIEACKKHLSAVIPMRRFGEPKEVIGAVLFLSSSIASSYITGNIINLDGGLSCSEIVIDT